MRIQGKMSLSDIKFNSRKYQYISNYPLNIQTRASGTHGLYVASGKEWKKWIRYLVLFEEVSDFWGNI